MDEQTMGPLSNHNDPVQVTPEITPNPDTVKFVINRRFFESGAVNFTDPEKTEGSPLAARLFCHTFVAEVLIGPDFVSVTKKKEADWKDSLRPVLEVLYRFFEVSHPPIEESLIPESRAEAADFSGGGESERKIREILDKEIRPAIAQDGGDVVFRGFHDGILELHLQGACRSCPSATITLKRGIEAYLKKIIPELKEVVQV
jgi:Fe-S cluster biogenesis protein NfuA